MPGTDLEVCENCGGMIGKLETACVFEGRIVCEACSERLNRRTSPPSAPPAAIPSTAKVCPSCQSGDTVTVRTAYARETHTSEIGGVGFDTDGDIGVFGGKSVSSSAFAKQIAPRLEREHSVLPAVVGWLIGVLSVGLFFGNVRDWNSRWSRDRDAGRLATVIGVVGMIVASPLIVTGLSIPEKNRWIRKRNSAVMHRWYRLWVCRRCGHQWQPSIGAENDS